MTSTVSEPFDPTLVVGNEYTVPRMGFGAIQLAGAGVAGLPDDVDGALAVLRHAHDQGVRFFDSANAYGPRTVNQLYGRALRPLPDDVVLGNKVGATRGPAGEFLHDTRPATVRAQVEDALFDQRADHSALTYLRVPGDFDGDANVGTEGDAPLAESLGALVQLREEGKVRHIGLSGASPEVLEQAQRTTPIAAVQNRFNLIDRSGVEVLAACERDDIAFVPYYPLALGGVENVEALTAPARRLGVPATTVALAWLLRRSRVIIPIPGTRSLDHLDANLGATAVASQLTDDEIATLTAVADESTATLGGMSREMTDALTKWAQPAA